MKRFGILILITILASSCVDKNSPEYRVKQYLIALKNQNWDEAKKYCHSSAIQNLDCSLRMGIMDMGITEIKNIKCKTLAEGQVDCYFCCMKNEPDPRIRLDRLDGVWLVSGVKESCPDDFPPMETDTLDNDTSDL